MGMLNIQNTLKSKAKNYHRVDFNKTNTQKRGKYIKSVIFPLFPHNFQLELANLSYTFSFDS